jgi:hypothetical protein
MIEHCGLVVKNTGKPNEILEENFQGLINRAMEAYKDAEPIKNKNGEILERDYSKAHDFRNSKDVYNHNNFAPNGELKIEFMGIWDTVSSLGVPQLGSFIDNIVNKKFPHLFYDYEPENCVKNVYHAIAVDDERLTFSPMVWNESTFKGGGTIEQVWFPGMHSNVGGGYNRQELATVTLDWMIEKLLDHKKTSKLRNGGLNLKKSVEDDAKSDANPFGKLHDSRSGGGIFYRYQPRNIKSLCNGRLRGEKVKIHISVFKRMKYRTGGYAPLSLPNPGDFEVVYTRNQNAASKPPTKTENEITDIYKNLREEIDKQIIKRTELYWLFLKSSLFLILISLIEWVGFSKKAAPPIEPENNIAIFEKLSDLNWWSSIFTNFGNAFKLLTDWTIWQENLSSFYWWFNMTKDIINWATDHISEVLNYFLPDFFEGIITLGVNNQPWLFLILCLWSKHLWTCRNNILGEMDYLRESSRRELLRLMRISK